MRPQLEIGQLLFSKSAKIRSANGTEITFTNADKKDYISVLIGTCPKGKGPNEKETAGLLGKCGLIAYCRI